MSTPTLQDYRPAAGLLLPTTPLRSDDKAWALYERDVFTNNYKELRREQAIRVMRGNRLVEFSCDIGLASDYTCGPFAVISLFEDSVGQAMEAADFLRGEAEAGLVRAMSEHLEDFNVVEGAIQQAEMVQRWMRQHSRTTRNLRLQKKDIT